MFGQEENHRKLRAFSSLVVQGAARQAADMKINTLLKDRHTQELTLAEIRTQVDQLKVLIDVCHLYGLAVIFDVVYNHAYRQKGGRVRS
ncbi:MAG: hypothetical protein J5U17_05535 [Candidatus Methanoperedens sp.]|nr:hypothetical protein [Candidatus Methanoperedens sp.]